MQTHELLLGPLQLSKADGPVLASAVWLGGSISRSLGNREALVSFFLYSGRLVFGPWLVALFSKVLKTLLGDVEAQELGPWGCGFGTEACPQLPSINLDFMCTLR